MTLWICIWLNLKKIVRVFLGELSNMILSLGGRRQEGKWRICNLERNPPRREISACMEGGENGGDPGEHPVDSVLQHTLMGKKGLGVLSVSHRRDFQEQYS